MNRNWTGCMAVGLLLSCSGKEPPGLYGSGTLEATEVLVSAEGPGIVDSLLVEEGAEVGKAQVLALLDTEKLATQRRLAEATLGDVRYQVESARAAVSQAQATWMTAEADLRRVRALVPTSSATPQQVEHAESQEAVARERHRGAEASLRSLAEKEEQAVAQRDLLDQQLADMTILAPTSGIAVTRFVEPGEFVRQGQPLYSIADLSRMWIKIYVPETDLGRVRVGGRADLRVDSFPGRSFTGRVAWISPKAEFTPKNVQTQEARVDLVYAVKVDLPNPGGELKIGMPADVYLEVRDGAAAR